MNPNCPARIQTFKLRGTVALLAAAGTLGAAALAGSALAVATGHSQWPAAVSQTPAPSPDQSDDYCMQDPNWYLCQHSHEKPITPSSDSIGWSR